jgi:predicted DCC family thiol-disulfide oxidoreductase YuxK
MRLDDCLLSIELLILLCMSHPVIFFDGFCNLCNGAVQFIIANDKRDVFRLTALQSEAAKALLSGKGKEVLSADSILLLENGKVYMRSTAALRIAKRLGAAWPMLYVCIIIPPFIRDYLYDVVAKNRYKVWGKRESCMLPGPDTAKKFI